MQTSSTSAYSDFHTLVSYLQVVQNGFDKREIKKQNKTAFNSWGRIGINC